MIANQDVEPRRTESWRYPERNLWAAARDALVWLSGPVSERGASRGFRISLHMGGRRIHERRLAMREHPIGRRLLGERPDLCAALNDMPALAAMPEGSLGRTFHTFMDHPETIPGYMLSGLVYRDDWIDSVPMDEELRWAFERWIQTHDLLHVVGGYGADLRRRGAQHLLHAAATTMGVSWKSVAVEPLRPGAAPHAAGASRATQLDRPTLHEAWERGVTAAREHLPFESVPWEELLPRAAGRGPRRRSGCRRSADPEMDSAANGRTRASSRARSWPPTSTTSRCAV